MLKTGKLNFSWLSRRNIQALLFLFRRYGDAQKNMRKSERRIKELTFAADEDRKNHERMQVGFVCPLQF